MSETTPSKTRPPLHFALRGLDWWLTETNIPFISAFLWLHLKRININTNTSLFSTKRLTHGSRRSQGCAEDAFNHQIFPPSIKFLAIYLDHGQEARLTGQVSRFILECGESLQEFEPNLVLSIKAVVHSINLPNLRLRGK